VSNNTAQAQPFEVRARSGKLAAVTELAITAPGPQTAGYYPPVAGVAPAGSTEPRKICAGEVRIFRMELKGAELLERPAVKVPDRTRGMALALREPRSLRREILSRPTLLDHVASVKIDAEYLARTEIEALRSEGAFLGRLGCGVIVDLCGLLTFYPELTLLDNIRSRWEASLKTILGVFDKAVALGARGILLSLHRNAENGFSKEQAELSFRAALSTLAREAASRSLALHLGHNPFRRFRPTMRETLEILRDVGAANLKPALSVGHALASREDPLGLLEGVELVLLSTPGVDPYGQFTDDHAPIAGSPYAAQARSFFAAARARPGLTTCLDGVYEDWDAVYRDLRYLGG
jgi:hypothetical protein